MNPPRFQTVPIHSNATSLGSQIHLPGKGIPSSSQQAPARASLPPAPSPRLNTLSSSAFVLKDVGQSVSRVSGPHFHGSRDATSFRSIDSAPLAAEVNRHSTVPPSKFAAPTLAPPKHAVFLTDSQFKVITLNPGSLKKTLNLTRANINQIVCPDLRPHDQLAIELFGFVDHVSTAPNRFGRAETVASCFDSPSSGSACVSVTFASADAAPSQTELEVFRPIRLIVRCEVDSAGETLLRVWWWTFIEETSQEIKYLQELVNRCPNKSIICSAKEQ